MNADIIIPTCKKHGTFTELVKQINKTRRTYGATHFTCRNESAAVNRNFGLNNTFADLIIMVDDDTGCFQDGWDKKLLMPLWENESIIMTSARLINEDGSLAYTMAENYDMASELVYCNKIPTACVGFRRTHLRFDENFIGSGFEDDDFCRQMLCEYGHDKYFAIVNGCEIIHYNEAKNQRGKYWEHNKKHFMEKWR